MNFKQLTYKQFEELLTGKILSLQKQLTDLKESAANETKSTAGDKYETARAMLQIEQDNIRRQLQEVLEQQAQFNTLDRDSVSEKIIQGSLINTNKGWLLLSVALGKAVVDDKTVIALSPQSPLGKLLLGKSRKDSISLPQASYIIEEIF